MWSGYNCFLSLFPLCFRPQCSQSCHFSNNECFSTKLLHNIDTLNICMKKFEAKKLIIDKMTAFVNIAIFSRWLLNRGYACA